MAAYVQTNTRHPHRIRRRTSDASLADPRGDRRRDLQGRAPPLLKVEYADATALADQVSASSTEPSVQPRAAGTGLSPRARAAGQQPQQIPGAPVVALGTATPRAAHVRIITDARTNSLDRARRASPPSSRTCAPSSRKLDVPVTGGGPHPRRLPAVPPTPKSWRRRSPRDQRVQTTARRRKGGSPRPARPASRPAGAAWGRAPSRQALRTVVEGLAEGITVTADPATNALVIQASQEGYATIAGVIENARHRAPAGARRGADHGSGRHGRQRPRLQRARTA